MNEYMIKQALNPIKADLFLSVGSVCMCAAWLLEFKLSKMSSPLDWMMKYDLNAVLRLFQNDFKDFFLTYENLGNYDSTHLCIKDQKTGMISIHHFLQNEDLNTAVLEFNALSIKKWRKIKNSILKAKDIVFIHNDAFDFKNSKHFLEEISLLFGKDKKFYLFNVSDDKNKQFNELTITQYKLNNKLKIIHFLGNNTSISTSASDFWKGNSFLWSLLMQHLSLKRSRK